GRVEVVARAGGHARVRPLQVDERHQCPYVVAEPGVPQEVVGLADRVSQIGPGVHVGADIATRGFRGGVVAGEVRIDVRRALGGLDVDELASRRDLDVPLDGEAPVVVAGDVDAA